MQATSFTISFPLDFWTRYRASRALTNRLWGTWFAYAFFVGVPTIIFIIMLISGDDLSAPGALDLPGWAILSSGYAIMFVFIPFLHIVQLWSASRRNRTLLGLQHQALTSEGFSTNSDAFSANFKWEAIYKALETKHFFFLYISSRAAYFIPKARLTGAGELENLRDVLRHYLHEKAHLRSAPALSME